MRQPSYHLRSEAEYFHELDSELIDGMRHQAALHERRLRLAEAAHVHHAAALDTLERLGYDTSTAQLLFVIPLIQVAWADGSVSQLEREHILTIASLRGVEVGSPTYGRLLEWLDRQPPKEFFETALSAIEAVLSASSVTERKACQEAVLLCCRDTAATPCHIFGWLSRVCAAKRNVIEQIRQRLELKQQAPG
jgi:hypothetical protein